MVDQDIKIRDSKQKKDQKKPEKKLENEGRDCLVSVHPAGGF
jgi:hypothetical protein